MTCARFFGREASTEKTRDDLIANVPRYEHHHLDIRDASAVGGLFQRYRGKIDAVVHTASQPAHDWAARDPHTDFTVNANGTLNLLEAARAFCPNAPFIFTSTNKVMETRESAATGGTIDTMGNRAGARLRTRNT